MAVGVALLAANDFFNGVWMVFFMEYVRLQQLRNALAEAQRVVSLPSCSWYKCARSTSVRKFTTADTSRYERWLPLWFRYKRILLTVRKFVG